MFRNAFMIAWGELVCLEHSQAEHIKGFRLGTYPDEDILRYSILEHYELIQEPDDEMEMADIMLCLLAYCERKKWTPEKLGCAMREKLRARFKAVVRTLDNSKRPRCEGCGRYLCDGEVVYDLRLGFEDSGRKLCEECRGAIIGVRRHDAEQEKLAARQLARQQRDSMCSAPEYDCYSCRSEFGSAPSRIFAFGYVFCAECYGRILKEDRLP